MSLLTASKVTEVPEENGALIHLEGHDELVRYHDVIALLPAERVNGSLLQSYELYCVSSSPVSGANGDSILEADLFKLKSFRLTDPPDTLFKYHLAKLPTHLQPASSELTVIVSIKSGTCQAEAFFHEVVYPLFKAIGLSDEDYKLRLTDSERWISDFASNTIRAKANAGVAQTIVLLSGDGGVIDIINGLFNGPQNDQYLKPVVSLLVLGTGNALANSSGLNTDASRGLPALLRGSPKGIPTLECKCSPGSMLLVDEARSTEELPTDDQGNRMVHGAVVASWCLHAALVADSDTTEYRKFGSERFSMAANELLAPSDGSPPHTWRGRITTFHKSQDGTLHEKVWERLEHMYILATMVSNLEATLKISPKSKPLDGQLRLIDFPALPATEVKQIFGMAFKGGLHVEHPDVGYASIEGLRIEFREADSRWRRICVDGKIIRVPENGWVEIRREERDVVDLIIGPVA